MDYLRKVSKSKNTRDLDLSCVGLWSFPSELARLKYLTVLSLTGNAISELSPEIAMLTALVNLSLADNNLKHVPVELARLSNLTELSLIDNELSSIPPGQHAKIVTCVSKYLILLPLQMHSRD